MIRKLGAVAVALLCVGAFAVGADAEAPSSSKAPAAAKSSVAMHGDYVGMDHQQRHVTFTYRDNDILNFKVGGHNFGNVALNHGAGWTETCSHGYCFKGSWVTSTHVSGFWKQSHGHWNAWSAEIPVQRTNFEGSYRGADHHGTTVTFTRHNDHVMHFKINNHTFDSVKLHNGGWSDKCNNGYCYRGHWQDNYHVAGYWKGPHSSHWIAWEAWAIAH